MTNRSAVIVFGTNQCRAVIETFAITQQAQHFDRLITNMSVQNNLDEYVNSSHAGI